MVIETDHKEDHRLLQELCTTALQASIQDYLPYGLKERAENYLRQNPNSWQHVEELLKLVEKVIDSAWQDFPQQLTGHKVVDAEALNMLQDYVTNYFGED